MGTLQGLEIAGGPRTDRERFLARALTDLSAAVGPLVEDGSAVSGLCGHDHARSCTGECTKQALDGPASAEAPRGAARTNQAEGIYQQPRRRPL